MKQRIIVQDNGGKTCDRYNVGYLDMPVPGRKNYIECVGMSENPFSPQGFGQYGEMIFPNHGLGKLVAFSSMPENCQKCVRQDFPKGTELLECTHDGKPIVSTRKKPWQENGEDYGEGPDGQRVCRGALMGRCNKLPDTRLDEPVKLHMERLRFVDGDYDQGGAYWGSGPNGSAVYCAYTENCHIFVRSKSRSEAKEKVREELPAARFYN